MNLSTFIASALAALALSATTTPTVVPVQTHCALFTQALGVGSSGGDVVRLQQLLNIKSTGYFGAITQRALTKWQISHGIISSAQSVGAGLLGRRTRAAMGCITSSITTTHAQVLAPTTSLRVIATTSTATTSPIVLPTAPPTTQTTNTGGGGGSSGVPHCPAFARPHPPASQCTTGSWVLNNDEAGCPSEWNCDDPNELMI